MRGDSDGVLLVAPSYDVEVVILACTDTSGGSALCRIGGGSSADIYHGRHVGCVFRLEVGGGTFCYPVEESAIIFGVKETAVG